MQENDELYLEVIAQEVHNLAHIRASDSQHNAKEHIADYVSALVNKHEAIISKNA